MPETPPPGVRKDYMWRGLQGRADNILKVTNWRKFRNWKTFQMFTGYPWSMQTWCRVPHMPKHQAFIHTSATANALVFFVIFTTRNRMKPPKEVILRWIMLINDLRAAQTAQISEPQEGNRWSPGVWHVSLHVITVNALWISNNKCCNFLISYLFDGRNEAGVWLHHLVADTLENGLHQTPIIIVETIAKCKTMIERGAWFEWKKQYCRWRMLSNTWKNWCGSRSTKMHPSASCSFRLKSSPQRTQDQD